MSSPIDCRLLEELKEKLSKRRGSIEPESDLIDAMVAELELFLRKHEAEGWKIDETFGDDFVTFKVTQPGPDPDALHEVHLSVVEPTPGNPAPVTSTGSNGWWFW